MDFAAAHLAMLREFRTNLTHERDEYLCVEQRQAVLVFDVEGFDEEPVVLDHVAIAVVQETLIDPELGGLYEPSEQAFFSLVVLFHRVHREIVTLCGHTILDPKQKQQRLLVHHLLALLILLRAYEIDQRFKSHGVLLLFIVDDP